MGTAPLLEEYLGDGVYATWDGYHIAFDLRMQGSVMHSRIALEPPVWAAAVRFHDRVVKYEQAAAKEEVPS